MTNLPALARRAALAATLALPFFQFYGRAIADSLICLIDILFLATCWRAGDFAWARRPWVAVAGAIWLWQLLASAVAGPLHSYAEGLVMVRYFVLVAALESWVLPPPRARQALWAVFLLLAGWTLLEVWQQYLTGTNINGFPRWPDGSLTGPFFKPRAGEVFLLVALPGLLPLVLMGLRAGDRLRRVGAVALLLLTVATMILIGQRMPNLLLLLGLVFTAAIERRFRLPLVAALGLAIVALAALPLISPPTWNKLVLHFIAQMSHFAASPYGQLYTRAVVMMQAHPWLGFGFEGFKDFCGDPAYFHGLPAWGVPNALNGGLEGCNLHPHNYYLQLGTMGGLPALLLFIALVALWLTTIYRRRSAPRAAIAAMLGVTMAVMFWPIASTSALFTPDTAGWVFLITGWALAGARREI
jgi:O-antigen ligase